MVGYKKLAAGILAAIGVLTQEAKTEEVAKEESLSDRIRFDIDAYSETDPYFHTDLDFKITDDLIVGESLTISDQRVTEAEGRVVTLTPRSYFGIALGTKQTTPLLTDSAYIKLQLGTRPETHPRFNQRVTLSYIHLPNLFAQREIIPADVIALSYGAQSKHQWPITKKWALEIKTDSIGSFFYSPLPSPELVEEMEYSPKWQPWMGDLSILLMSHWRTDSEFMLKRGRFAFGIEEDLDLGLLTIAYHMLKARGEYKYIKFENAFGLRTADLFTTDTENWLYTPSHLEELITIPSFVLFPNKNIRLKAYSEYSITEPTNSIMVASLQGDIKRLTIEPYYKRDGRLDNESFGINFSFNSGKKSSYINPKDYSRGSFGELPEQIAPIGETGLSKYTNASAIHSEYGKTLAEAVTKIGSYEDLSKFISNFSYELNLFRQETAKEVYRTGNGDCKGINGALIPYVVEKALGYRAEEKYIFAVGKQHVIAAAWNNQGTIDIIDFTQVYRTGEKDLQKAIQKVYPGALIIEGANHTQTVLDLRDIAESPIYTPF